MNEPTLILGDCVEEMRKLDAESIHAVCTDPPYLLAFMGKDFDRQDGAHADPKKMQEWHERWAREAFRVLKPGGFLLAFGGTRTYHRLACAVEDAGFEIRDRFWTPGGEAASELAWMFGSGFPKSLDVSKAIDKAAGVEGEVVGVRDTYRPEANAARDPKGFQDRSDGLIRVAATPDAERWQGWGTALKPAHEPIVVARKPLIGTVAANVLAHGTGAINVDGCRIAADGRPQFVGHGDDTPGKNTYGSGGPSGGSHAEGTTDFGRWPANVILSHLEACVRVGTREVASDGHYPSARPGATEITTVGHVGQADLEERHTRGETVEQWECATDCPVAELDGQSGERRSAGIYIRGSTDSSGPAAINIDRKGYDSGMYADAGGPSRFFYCAKVSRAERNAGLEGFAEIPHGTYDPVMRNMARDGHGGEQSREKAARNHHPTVKPIAMMRWLVRLVTPPGGTVLDPFLGSGSTGCAAALESCVGQFVGIERDPDYMRIAEARIAFWAEHGEDGLRIIAEREQAERRRREVEDAGQLDLFAGQS